jgi:DNA-binding response OmpR family regulator
MANYQILIIDDDPVISQIAQRILEKKGYAVRVAMDARKGLALALTYPPNLIVLDYMMPQKDGLMLLADIRATPELKEVPVIMMTGVSEQDIVAKAIQLGVTDFMVKPFYPPRLLERVQKHLPLPEPPKPGDETERTDDMSGTAPGTPPEL